MKEQLLNAAQAAESAAPAEDGDGLISRRGFLSLAGRGIIGGLAGLALAPYARAALMLPGAEAASEETAAPVMPAPDAAPVRKLLMSRIWRSGGIEFTSQRRLERQIGRPGYLLSIDRLSLRSDIYPARSMSEIMWRIATLIGRKRWHMRCITRFPQGGGETIPWSARLPNQYRHFAALEDAHMTGGMLSARYACVSDPVDSEPSYQVRTFNFLLYPQMRILGHRLIELSSMFLDPGKVFPLLRDRIVTVMMMRRHNGDYSGGLSPENLSYIRRNTWNWRNFSAFSVTEEGIVIYFNHSNPQLFTRRPPSVTLPYDSRLGGETVAELLMPRYRHAVNARNIA